MRLLHTADWHVGKKIGERSRTPEFAAVLDEVVRVAEAERVDAILVAGDLYERKSPLPDADKLVFEAIARLFHLKIPLVAIAGNHDSPARFDALEPLLRPLGVHVVPEVASPTVGTVVEVTSRDGTEATLISCVPFLPERYFGSTRALFEGSEKWSQQYAEGMGDLFRAMAEPFRPDRVNVLMAHCFATDVKLGGGENEFTVALDYAVPPSRFPGTATYIALGHVHKPQAVPAAPAPTRYAGSLLQLDFGEVDQRKSVVVVEASPGKPARVREVPLSAGRRLLDVAGTIDELRAQASSLGDAYLRVTVSAEAPLPGLPDQVREALPNAVQIRVDYPRRPDEEPTASVMRLVPEEQFLAYYLAAHAAEAPDELRAAFREVLAAVGEEVH